MITHRQSGDNPGLRSALGVIAARLRSLPESRLAPRAGEARTLAQWLADAAAGVAQHAAAVPPPSRAVPDVGIFAVGDQVAVTGADLLAAVEALAGETAVWSAGARRPLADVLTEALARAEALRATL